MWRGEKEFNSVFPDFLVLWISIMLVPKTVKWCSWREGSQPFAGTLEGRLLLIFVKNDYFLKTNKQALGQGSGELEV